MAPYLPSTLIFPTGHRGAHEEGLGERCRLPRPHRRRQAAGVLDAFHEPLGVVLGTAQSSVARVLFLSRGAHPIHPRVGSSLKRPKTWAKT